VKKLKLEELKSVKSDVAAKLSEIGVNSVEALIVKGFSEVKALLPEVDEKELRKIFMEAWRLKGFWLMTAKELAEREKERLVFSTGCKALDTILGGGVYSWSITEFAGEYGVGKSQILMTLMIEALNKHPEFCAVYLDSENTCRDARLKEICEARGYDTELLSRVIYIPTVETSIFFEIVDRLPITVEARNVKLICSDSLIAPLRAEYVGRETLAERQQILNSILRKLLSMARVYNLAVAVANQVVAVPQQTYVYTPFGQKLPVGGHIMAHNTDPRVWIRKGEGFKRIARIFDSSWLPERECVFRISEKGIEDIGQ